MIHEIPLERGNLHGHFSRELEPVLTIDPGDSVRIDVPNAGWRVVGDRPMIPNEELKGLGHALAGPIEVRRARAGQTLSIRVDEVVPGSWGVDDHAAAGGARDASGSSTGRPDGRAGSRSS